MEKEKTTMQLDKLLNDLEIQAIYENNFEMLREGR